MTKKTDHAAFKADLNQLTKLERQRANKARRLNDKIQALQEKHQSDIAGLTLDIDALRKRINTYATKHRDVLTDQGRKKTLTIGACAVKWRKKPASVEITGDPINIIAALKKRRMSDCISIKTNINKTAIKAHADRLIKHPIEGITFTEGGEVVSVDIAI